MSHQVTSNLISTMGKEFDAKVHEWRQELLTEVESHTELEVNIRNIIHMHACRKK